MTRQVFKIVVTKSYKLKGMSPIQHRTHSLLVT